jgi:threonine/homoserine/homoserine lactone efflux protein
MDSPRSIGFKSVSRLKGRRKPGEKGAEQRMDLLLQGVLLLLKAIVIGFAVAAPVGPIGMLCIRRTLADGRRAGFVSGLGAATADAIYGLLAAVALSLVKPFIESHVDEISVVGGIFLLALGYFELRAKPIDPAAGPPTTLGLVGHFFTAMFWTLANPITILTFIAIFFGLDVVNPEGQVGVIDLGGPIDPAQQQFLNGIILVVGILLGSTAWWLVLTQGVGMFRHHFFGPGTTTRWPNFIAGTLIIAFGLYAVTAAFNLF